MSAILYNTYLFFSRLYFSVKSFCSVRHLASILPVGVPAPRLNVQLAPIIKSNMIDESSDSCVTDETYTSTTSLTDFDEEIVRGRTAFISTTTSTPSFSKYACRGKLAGRRVRSDRAVSDADDSGYAPNFIRVKSDEDCAYSHALPIKSRREVQKLSTVARIRSRKLRGYGHENTNSWISSLSSQSSSPSSPTSAREMYKHHRRRYRNSKIALPNCHTPIVIETDRGQCDRINHLEEELARLRSQLAQLIVKQEGKQILYSPDIGDRRLDGDGESDVAPVRETQPDSTDEQNVESNVPPAPSICPPPPNIPPPPPLPVFKPKVEDDWRARLIATKKKQGSQQKSTTNVTSTGQAVDMNQVLKELQSGSIKLRTVPRSPGGTPIRSNQRNAINGSDPGSIIARAMQSKFSSIRAALDLSVSGGENTPNDSTEESCGQHRGRLAPTTRERTPTSEKSIPPFGQHMLKPISENTRHVSPSSKR